MIHQDSDGSFVHDGTNWINKNDGDAFAVIPIESNQKFEDVTLPICIGLPNSETIKMAASRILSRFASAVGETGLILS